jgi:Flp pilus assembly secretin CpaC
MYTLRLCINAARPWHNYEQISGLFSPKSFVVSSVGILKRSVTTCVTALLAATLFLAAGSGRSGADPTDQIFLQTGHSSVLQIDGLTRVAVGDGRIAGVVPIGTSELIINGKSPGKTSVFVWAYDRRIVYEVTVSNQVLDDLSQMLRAAISEPSVQVISFGHSIVLRGFVPDMTHFVQLSDVVSRFDAMSHQEKYTIVNAVIVTHSLSSLQREFASSPTIKDLQIEPDGKGNVLVSGRVHDRTEAERVLDRARQVAGPFLAADGKLIDRLSTDTATSINVKVYVLEIDRTGLSDLGLQLQSGTPDPNNPRNLIIGQPNFPIIESPNASLPGKALNIGPFYRTVLLLPTLNLVLQSGHARILSEPNLVSVPGAKATFMVGGQIPYVFSTGLGQVSVAFKNYGVQLTETPTILPNGTIETVINPDISDLDFQNAVQLAGFFIPAFKESTLSTDVITHTGESIIMGGLLRRLDERTISKIPILSSLPILGKLFQSTSYKRSDTDIVFIMTPEIIDQ